MSKKTFKALAECKLSHGILQITLAGVEGKAIDFPCICEALINQHQSV